MRSMASVHCSSCWTITFGSGASYGDWIDFVVLFGQIVTIILPSFPLFLSSWQYCCRTRVIPIIGKSSKIHKKAIGFLSAKCGEFKKFTIWKCSVMVEYLNRRCTLQDDFINPCPKFGTNWIVALMTSNDRLIWSY